MPYPNLYLRDFAPVFGQILEEKQIAKKRLHLEIIDEEAGDWGVFETAGVDEVLEQLAGELNHLSIYTERRGHFAEFSRKMYEENGLMTVFFPKKELRRGAGRERENASETLVLDFEREGACRFALLAQGKNYIPIYKKPWKIAENLDIIVPFGYNTVIVKSEKARDKKPVRDRFEKAFYAVG